MGKVRAKLFGFFVNLAGGKEWNVEFEDNITIGDIINQIDKKSNGKFKKSVIDHETQRLRNHVILLLNGRNITRQYGLDKPLKDEDELSFFTVSSGG